MTTMPLFRKAAYTTLTLLLLSPFALPAQSLAPVTGVDGLPAVVVKNDDLDLSNPGALDVLLQRLKNAARTTCAQFDSSQLTRHQVYVACVDRAIEGAIIRTEMPALAALYTEKTGKKLAPSALMTAHR